MEYLKEPNKFRLKFIIVTILMCVPLFPLLVFDLLAEIYHHFAFPVYGLPKVKRSEYVLVMDRNKLQYLTWYQKLGCMYCGYVNGVLLYLKEISGRTEKFWCGIMHENKPGFKVQEHQINQDFAKFNDDKDFKQKYQND
jgi:hypothetical protein